MTEDTKKEPIERRLAAAELKFERRFRHLQEVFEGRMAALEAELDAAHEKIAVMDKDIIGAMIDNFQFLDEADKRQGEVTDTIVFDMTYMKDRLDAVFDKLFPDHARYAAAILDIIDKNWRKDQ